MQHRILVGSNFVVLFHRGLKVSLSGRHLRSQSRTVYRRAVASGDVHVMSGCSIGVFLRLFCSVLLKVFRRVRVPAGVAESVPRVIPQRASHDVLKR